MSDRTLTVRPVAAADFDRAVVEASRTQPVVVDFWAPWCGPCRQLSPLIERVAARHSAHVTAVKVNVDEAPALSARYRIQGIPTVMAFKDGQVAATMVGLQPEATLERLFAGLAPSAADRLAADAAAASDPAERERLLLEALEEDADHPAATLALAELLAERGDSDRALALAERLPGDAAARRLAARLRLSKLHRDSASAPAGALDGLLAAARNGDAAAGLQAGLALAARGDHGDALALLVAAVGDPDVRDPARDAVLGVFAVLGEDDPLVRQWRPKLAAALF